MPTKNIKQRVYGCDADFMEWIRNCHDLPSREGHTRTCVQDVDFYSHNFMTAVDKIGTRDIQTIKLIEVKTRGGRPDAAQRDTLWKVNIFSNTKITKGKKIIFHGVFFIFLSGTTPRNSDEIYWGYFDSNGNIIEKKICYQILIDLLLSKRNPKTLQGEEFRRHHKTEIIIQYERAALGFLQEAYITHRS